MLTAQNLTKRYGSLQVLKGVSLTLKEGQVAALMGRSGAGKTTLLQLLGLLDAPDSGSIQFQGQELTTLKSKALAHFRNQSLGFVFQFHNLMPEFTALENVAMPGWIAGQPDRDVRQKAATLLDELGLKERVSHKPAALSGGEQQRVAIARALFNQPKLILADEPTGNLDLANGQAILALFRTIAAQKRVAFFVATHNQEFATACDVVYRLDDGVLVDPAS